MRRVVIESPFAGDTVRNLAYLRAAMADCLRRGDAPFASHGLYTQPGVLDDDKPIERELGIVAGFAWRDVAELTAVYADLGISKGMQYGIDDATRKGRPVEYRTLTGWVRDAHVDVARCVTCDWPLAASRDQGCVDGDCSYRGAL